MDYSHECRVKKKHPTVPRLDDNETIRIKNIGAAMFSGFFLFFDH